MQTKAQRKASLKYRKKTYEQIAVQIRHDNDFTREDVKTYAEKAGMSVNEFVLQAIREKIAEGMTEEIERIPFEE